MFEIGFGELLLVALVALLVLGPERLPVAARVTGLWIGRLRRSFSSIRAEVEREIGADDIRLQLHNERILEQERNQLNSRPPVVPVKPEADIPPVVSGAPRLDKPSQP